VLSAMIAIISVVGLDDPGRALRGRDYRVIGLSGRRGVRARRLALLARLLVCGDWCCSSCSPCPSSRLSQVRWCRPMACRSAFQDDVAHAYEEILFRQAVTRTAFTNSLSLSPATAFGLLVVTVLTAYFADAAQGAGYGPHFGS
jgi:iron(III) transport system permease protein